MYFVVTTLFYVYFKWNEYNLYTFLQCKLIKILSESRTLKTFFSVVNKLCSIHFENILWNSSETTE